MNPSAQLELSPLLTLSSPVSVDPGPARRSEGSERLHRIVKARASAVVLERSGRPDRAEELRREADALERLETAAHRRGVAARRRQAILDRVGAGLARGRRRAA